MSKMGNAILAVQDMVDNGVAAGNSFNKIMNDVFSTHGSMFEEYAEEYYEDIYCSPSPEDYAEVHSVEGYEELVKDLVSAGVLEE